MFILNPASGVPIYRQLLEQVRRMVASGRLLPGTELPSIRDLALRHAVNPMTISKAYSLLETEGLLERNRGKQMTVRSVRRATPARAPLDARLRQIKPQLGQLVLAAKQLQLTQAELTRALHQHWHQDEKETSDESIAAR